MRTRVSNVSSRRASGRECAHLCPVALVADGKVGADPPVTLGLLLHLVHLVHLLGGILRVGDRARAGEGQHDIRARTRGKSAI